MNINTLIPTLLLLLLFFAIPIFVGFYVYKDASSRGMKAILWALLSIVTPGLLGLVLYFIARTGHNDIRYNEHDTQTRKHFAADLHYDAVLPDAPDAHIRLTSKKEKEPGKLLLLLLIAPLLLCIVLVIFFRS